MTCDGRSKARRGGRPHRQDATLIGNAILRAAEAEFLANGFSGARIEAIAQAAGTSKQTIYARYGSKEALFIAVSNEILRDRFIAPPRDTASLRNRLVYLADQMLDAILDPRLIRMYTMITSEAARFPELARMSDDDENFPVRAMVEQLLADAGARGELMCDDPHEAMLLVTSMIMAQPIRAAQLGMGFGLDKRKQWARFTVDLFLKGLGAGLAGARPES